MKEETKIKWWKTLLAFIMFGFLLWMASCEVRQANAFIGDCSIWVQPKGYFQPVNKPGDSTGFGAARDLCIKRGGGVITIGPGCEGAVFTYPQNAHILVIRESINGWTSDPGPSGTSPGGIFGPDIASATTINLGLGNLFNVIGSVTTTDISLKPVGTTVKLYTSSAWTIQSGPILVLNGNFVGDGVGNYDSITLTCDGTHWREDGRSMNGAGIYTVPGSASNTQGLFSINGSDFITKIRQGQFTLNLDSIPAATTLDAKIYVTGLDVAGNWCLVTSPLTAMSDGLGIDYTRCKSNDTLEIRFRNVCSQGVNNPNMVFKWMGIK